MNNIIIYNTEDGKAKINLILDDGSVWLSQSEIAELFQTTKQNISKHIKSIFQDLELSEKATHRLSRWFFFTPIRRMLPAARGSACRSVICNLILTTR